MFKKLYGRLSKNDNYKYLPPKFSYAMKDLAEYYGIFLDMDGRSSTNDFLSNNGSSSSLSTVKQLNSLKGRKKSFKGPKAKLNIPKPKMARYFTL